MSPDPAVTRRAVLAAGAGAAGVAALAACSSSDSGSPTGTASASAPPASAGRSADPPAGNGTASTTQDSGTSSGGGESIATLADVPVGGAISVDLPDGKPAIVARPTATTAVCFSAICTHQGCTVKPAGKTLDCPCHGSKYNAFTGAVLNPPAPSPLKKVSVAVRDGEVVAT